MKQIALTQGQVALVDDEDFERLNQYKWCAHFQPNRANGGSFNAVRNGKVDGKFFTVLMHREIVNAPNNKQVDHKDRDSLNNQKSNLRLADHSQNGMNRGLHKNNSSGYKGVYFRKDRDRFMARIKKNGRVISLGCYQTAAEAAHKYNEAAVELFGEFAVANEIQEGK